MGLNIDFKDIEDQWKEIGLFYVFIMPTFIVGEFLYYKAVFNYFWYMPILLSFVLTTIMIFTSSVITDSFTKDNNWNDDEKAFITIAHSIICIITIIFISELVYDVITFKRFIISIIYIQLGLYIVTRALRPLYKSKKTK